MRVPNKPNVVFILIDDLGWRDLGCYGSSFYETPNIDALARNGMLFTDAYAASPVCSPTRASIMSGKYPGRVGVTNYIGGNARGRLIDAPYVDHLPSSEVSLAASLKRAGYTTWHVGKWHLGGPEHYPERHGFDLNIAGCSWGMPLKGYFSPWGIETLSDGAPGEYLTDRLTDEAVRLIREHQGGPFFLNLWHYAVHTPLQAKKEDVDYFTDKAKRLGLDRVDALDVGERFPCEHKRKLHVERRLFQSNPVYAAMVKSVDDSVGRIVRALEETGRLEDTMVIFTSDNGGLSTSEGSPTCNFPLAEGKGWMYEGGLRVPLIVSWPAEVRPGSVNRDPVSSPDFYPTIMEAVGSAPPPEQRLDGVSLMSALRGGGVDRSTSPFPGLYWHFPHYGNQGGTPGSSLRLGDYKLIEFYEDGRLELYALHQDLSEVRNLALQEPARCRAMHQALARWRSDVSAKTPAPNPDWNPLLP